jgi:pimeloyl-ACP methyl ester carboxylesterase
MREQVTAAGFRTIVFDNRGIPPSSCPAPPWTVSDMADDASGLIDELGLGPCHLIGGSLGALTAQTVALRRPDLVRSAVLYVGGGNASATGMMQAQAILKLTNAGIEIPPELIQLAALQAFLTPEQMVDDDTVRAMLPMLLAGAAGNGGPWGPGGREGQMAAGAGWAHADHLEELAEMQPPCLFLAAEFDRMFPPKNMKAAAAKAPRGEYAEVAGSAHVTFDATHLAFIQKTVVEFLERQRSR